MSQQIAYAYGSNRIASIPLKLDICGYGKFLENRLDQLHASTSWKAWGVTVTPEPIEKLYESKKDKLVYLSADSDKVLEKLEPDTVYIIGGIVDRNRHKGLCANKANQLGIPTAKFPLDAYFAKTGFSRVLTTNHCVDILLEFVCCGDWMQACKRGVPIRKLKTRNRKKTQTNDDNQSEAGEEEDADEDGDNVNAEEDAEENQAKGTVPLDQGNKEESMTVAYRSKHALIIGASEPFSIAVAKKLFSMGWSVLLVDNDVETLQDVLQNIRLESSESGEVAICPVDCSLDADVIRLKEIIFQRFERTIDAIICTQVDACEANNFLVRALPVRELFRIWAGKDRIIPRFVFRQAISLEGNAREWMDELSRRLEGHVLELSGTVGDEVDRSLQWVTTIG
jgi:hypothetical protein